MIAKDIGFVLRRTDFRDSSVIADIYTLNFGRMSGILKGFYTGKKEFTSDLELFSLNEFVFYPRHRDIWLISYVDMVADHDFLRVMPQAAGMAGLFAGLISRTMPPWEPNQDIFYLLQESFERLRRLNDRRLAHWFLLRYLELSGFKPEFNRCLFCRGSLAGVAMFSTSQGGLLCRSCSRRAPDARPISPETAAGLLYMQENEFDPVSRLRLSSEARVQIAAILRQFLLYHLEIDVVKYLKPQREGALLIA
jgi:DNA repair protein RecO (recombination protein O)